MSDVCNRVFLLNSPVLAIDFDRTSCGLVGFRKIDVNEAKDIVLHAKNNNILISAIGHESTAKLLSQLFKTEIPVNRVRVHMDVGDMALVVALTTRLPEGKILSEDEIKQLFNNGKIHFILLHRIK